jgi:protein-disulfide isomerase-like protein with CxxC motif
MVPPRPSPVVFALTGRIAPGDVARLCERIGALLDGSGAPFAVCDLRDAAADAATVDALARIQLAARRRGRRVFVRHASAELRELVVFIGLGDVLGR